MNIYDANSVSTPVPRELPPVVLIRHAQSQWNAENRFTGWADPPLTENGLAEAAKAGGLLRTLGYRFDIAYSSVLQRARTTLDLLLDQIGQAEIPRHEDWRLNERHYGALQGTSKTDAAARVGRRQVWRWRRGYADRPAPLLITDPRHPVNDVAYAGVEPQLLPGAENLAQTRARVMLFWNEQIAPRLQHGERILVSAHGNTLRALLMELAGMSVQEVERFEIPTATPILYWPAANGQSMHWRYLGSTEIAFDRTG